MVLLANALTLTASAASFTWVGAGADDYLNNALNWAGGVAPTSADDVIFTGFVRNSPTASVAQIYFTVTFDAGAGPFVISGSTITTGTTTPSGGNVTNLSSYGQTFNCSLAPRTGTFLASGGDIILNGGFNVGNGGSSSGRNVTVDGTKNVVVNTALTGTGTDTSAGGQLIKNGAGILFLNGSSPSWNGKITLNLGSLVITNNNGLGSASGSTVINSSGGSAVWDGKLILSNSLTLTEPFTLGARQQGSLNSAHILNVATTNTLSGNLNLTTGGSRYNLQSDGGKLVVAGLINAGTLTSTREFRVAGSAEGELRGPISGGGSTIVFQFIKEGSGTWTLTGTNAVSGNTLVNAGTFALGPNGKITGSTNITVAAGATLDVAAVTGGFVLAGNQTLTGSGSVAGNLTASAGSRVRPGGSGAPGTMAFANDLTQTATTTNYFDLGGSTTPGGGNDLITVAGSLEPNGAVIVISALGQLVAPGTYRLFNYSGTKTTSFGGVVSADNRYSFTLDESIPGQVNVIVSGAPASLVWSGGTAGNWDVATSLSWNSNTERFYQADAVAFDDTTTGNSVNLLTTLYPSAVTVSSASNYVFQGAGKLSGAVGLNKSGSGSLSLNNANDFTGPVNISGGTLIAGNNAALGATNGGTVVSGGGTLDISAKNLGAEAITISGAGVADAGALVNNGADQQNAVQFVALAADASGGGTGRWDSRGGGGNSSFSGRFDLNGYTFTKTGSSRVGIIDSIATNAGSLQIASGLVSITRSLVDGPGVIDLTTNTLYFENCSTGYVVKPILSSGGRIQLTGSAFTLGSPITNLAGLTVDNSLDLTLTNTITGAGGLTKVNAGNLILQAPVDYSGSTLLVGGTLTLGATTSLPNTPSITLSNDATLDATLPGGLTLNGAAGQVLAGSGTVVGNVTAPVGSAINPGLSPGTLTFNNALALNNVSCVFELGASPFTPGANDQVVVFGGLIASGVTTVKIVPLATLDTVNPYTLFQNYGLPLPSGSEFNFSVISDSRYSFVVLPTDNYFGAQVNVQVSGSGTSALLIWQGNNSVNPTYWDTKTTANWLNGASADMFFAGDTAVFDDTAIGTTAALVGTLQPAQVLLSNASKTITMAGAGGFNAGSLAVEGAGLTRIANTAGNSFVSGVTVNNGTLVLANTSGNTLGAVSVPGGSLVASNSGVNAFSPLGISGGSVLIANGVANTFAGIALDSGTLTFDQPLNVAVGGPITGVGSFIKNGTNILTLNANNSSFSGPIQVNTGILRAGVANALGSGSGLAFDGTTIAPGATLDVNAINLGNELVTVSGVGMGGLGAIVNNSGTGQNNALHDVALTGDTTFGGIGRWDIRSNGTGAANLSTGGNACNITKLGVNQVSIVNATVDTALGDVDVQQGIFGYEGSSTGLGNPGRTVTVQSNATFQTWSLANPLDKAFLLREGGILRFGSGTSNYLTGPVALESGNVRINAASGASGVLLGPVSGAGGFTKSDTGTVVLSGTNTFTGNITNLAGGVIMFSNNLSAGTNKLVWVNSTTGGSGSTGARVTLAGDTALPADIAVSFNSDTNGDIRSTFYSQAGSNLWQGPVEARGSGIVNVTVDSPNTFVISGPITGAAGFTGKFFIRGSGNGILNGTVNLGGGELPKTDSGTWTINSTGNTWALTTIAVGTVRLGVSDALCPTAPLLMGQGDTQAAALDLNGFNQTLARFLPTAGTGTRRIGNDSTVADSLFTYDGGTNVSIFAGQFVDNLTVAGTRKLALTVASGRLQLDGASTHTGNTLVTGGTLAIGAAGTINNTAVIDVRGGATLDVSAKSPALVLASGQTLKGNGTVLGSVTVGTGATLSAGASIGALTVTNVLLLQAGSSNVFELNKSAGTNDVVNAGSVTYGGTLVLDNLGPALLLGNTFKLFNASTYNGAFAAISPEKPGTGLAWDISNLTVNGTISVKVGIPTTPTNLTYQVSGSTLTLSWPPEYRGWVAQSNKVNVSVSNYWYDIPGSASVTNLSLALSPAETNVYYRLRLP